MRANPPDWFFAPFRLAREGVRLIEAGSGFDQLDPVAERIGDKAPTEVSELAVPAHRVPCVGEGLDEVVQPLNYKRRMGLLGRPETVLDAEMYLHVSVLEPPSASGGERGGLGSGRKAKDRLVEGLRLGFSARGHRDLDVVEPDDPVGSVLALCRNDSGDRGQLRGDQLPVLLVFQAVDDLTRERGPVLELAEVPGRGVCPGHGLIARGEPPICPAVRRHAFEGPLGSDEGQIAISKQARDARDLPVSDASLLVAADRLP